MRRLLTAVCAMAIVVLPSMATAAHLRQDSMFTCMDNLDRPPAERASICACYVKAIDTLYGRFVASWMPKSTGDLHRRATMRDCSADDYLARQKPFRPL